jgi:hypothetical protein
VCGSSFLAAVLGRYGGPIKGVLDRHLNAVLAGLAAVIILGFVAFRYLF